MERDFPLGHPAACDYKGEKYNPPKAPWQVDYEHTDPARGGRNTSHLDTPDGMREALTVASAARAELADLGAPAPAVSADYRPVSIEDARKAEATEYLETRGFDADGITSIFSRYSLDEILADKAAQK
jgi:hypothetical protein